MNMHDPALPSRRIVLVEDDYDVRRSLTLLLRARGYGVDAYRSGAELFTNLTLPVADCFVIDFKMPLFSGLELLQKLRKSGVATPALLITGHFSNTLADRARAAGYSEVIEKPILGEVFLKKLEQIIEPVPR